GRAESNLATSVPTLRQGGWGWGHGSKVQREVKLRASLVTAVSRLVTTFKQPQQPPSSYTVPPASPHLSALRGFSREPPPPLSLFPRYPSAMLCCR
ncbi:hypothetical protein KUCAC02_003672, partial [Chaenocephalus aceratus]